MTKRQWTWLGVLAVVVCVVAVVAGLAGAPGSASAQDSDTTVWLLLPLAAWLAGLAFLIWFIVTLNRIARHLGEQTRLARAAAERLARLDASTGRPADAER